VLRKIIFVTFIFYSLKGISQQPDTTFLKYFYSIKSADLKKHLEVLASDAYEGRMTGEWGQQLAAQYISSYFEKINAGKYNGKSYLQDFVLRRDSLPAKKKIKFDGDLNTANVIAVIEGNKLKDECIVISAHYDHLGKREVVEWNKDAAADGPEKTIAPPSAAIETDAVFNGADDDGSGTVALLDIAEAFMKAKKEGHGPQRTIIIVAFTGEELGLWGSKYYVKNPVIPLEKTVADLNIDMIGRVDAKHKDTTNYIYLIGADRISSELKLINEKVNNTYTNLFLDYSYDISDENRYYYRSDHYNFARNNVPVVFYFNGTHEDYHKETDEIEKINFDLLEKRARLVFCTAWELANMEKRIVKDKTKKDE
jgi:hypothetical protein